MIIGKWKSFMSNCNEIIKGGLNIADDGYAQVKLHAPYSMVNIASEVTDYTQISILMLILSMKEKQIN